MKTEVKLKIADIIIRMRSRFPHAKLTREERRPQMQTRFKNFLYKGKKTPDIMIKVDVVDKLPEIGRAEPVFITYHFQDGSENWRLLKKGNGYIYEAPLEGNEQLMLINKSFNVITAHLVPDKEKGRVWDFSDIIYDFLQVLLINYLAQRKSGIFTHAIGVKDIDGRGLLFSGKSGCGKTATAKLWHKHSKAMVLNDDRVIVRKVNGKFLMYGSPWHGEFADYLTSRIESAPLERQFFIYHGSENRARQVSKKEAFKLLYPALFPTFWDKECLENVVSLAHEMIESVPCYRLGFVNDKRVISFVRKI